MICNFFEKGIDIWISKCYNILAVKERQELNGKEIESMEVLEDKDREIRNQERELKAKLEALGVVVEDLKIE